MAKDIQQHKPFAAFAKHTARHKPRTRERRGSARQRGYTGRWDRFSKAFLAANPLCEFCLGQGRTKAAQVTDHDLPHEGDTELFWNNTFTALCKRCHDSTKQRLEGKYKGDALLEAIAARKGGKV